MRRVPSTFTRRDSSSGRSNDTDAAQCTTVETSPLQALGRLLGQAQAAPLDVARPPRSGARGRAAARQHLCRCRRARARRHARSPRARKRDSTSRPTNPVAPVRSTAPIRRGFRRSGPAKPTATTSMPTRSSSEAARGFSTASTASSAAIATASWDRSGSRVVSRWSWMPGHIRARAQRLVRFLPNHLISSNASPATIGMPTMREMNSHVPVELAERREHDDGHDHHEQQEARAAARVEARVALRVLGRERLGRLVARDRLVLGAVVLEHALEVRHARDQPEVGEEDA